MAEDEFFRAGIHQQELLDHLRAGEATEDEIAACGQEYRRYFARREKASPAGMMAINWQHPQNLGKCHEAALFFLDQSSTYEQRLSLSYAIAGAIDNWFRTQQQLAKAENNGEAQP